VRPKVEHVSKKEVADLSLQLSTCKLKSPVIRTGLLSRNRIDSKSENSVRNLFALVEGGRYITVISGTVGFDDLTVTDSKESPWGTSTVE
jgi:hypothetical protein